MYNSVTLVGYLGKDPEVRQANGTAVARLSLATSERFTDRQGKRREETQWHTLVAWGKLAELAEQYLAKGSRVMAEGKLTYRNWEDRNGHKQTSTEIVLRKLVFLDGSGKGRDEAEPEDIPF